MNLYAEVIVPVPLGTTFTYSIPEYLRGEVRTGVRVVVSFGGSFYTGIVENLHNVKPEGYDVKDITSVQSPHPVVVHPQIKLWRWISEYYLCSIGEVMRAAIPGGLKIESETRVQTNPDMEADEAAAVLSPRELTLWQTLATKGETDVADLESIDKVKNITAILNRMLEKGAVIIGERIQERFRPKKEKYVRLTFDRGDTKALHEAFNAVSRSKRQENVLQTLVAMSRHMQPALPREEVTKAALLEATGTTSPIITALAHKGLLEEYTREVSRFSGEGLLPTDLPRLSEAQQTALEQIRNEYKEKRVVLLHGITGSGKTEIYMHLIQEILDAGNQALFLVPEIALTTQLTRRIQKVFGNQVLIYHSKFSDNQRVETWMKLVKNRGPYVIIGARSSIFLPFGKLGLVIVDEEHDPSYKQFDPAPRYNARDTAIMLASMHGAKVLLGSATPGVDTYYKANTGKYGLVKLTERFHNARLPQIKVVDIKKARLRKEMQGLLAKETYDVIKDTLKNGNQVILFHNRRGYAPVARCQHCGYVPKCQYCDVSLTYHRHFGRMVCHYCGATAELPEICPVCKEPGLQVIGYGTERIEDNLEDLFHDVRMLRMDLDSTRRKDKYSQIIDDFSNKKADILVGTQMVSKGLDFNTVSTVAILDADSIISYPDFRASERAFNMLEQVSGRAGRNKIPGIVTLQTRNPEHPIIEFVSTHNYEGFYRYELEERRKFSYPPFSKIIYIYIKNRDAEKARTVADVYAADLKALLGNRVYGPEEPMVARVQNQFIRRIMIKIEPTVSMSQIKQILRNSYVALFKKQKMYGMTIYYDVDPW